MENRYDLVRQVSGVWRSLRDGDFEEEDVWAVIKERNDNFGPKIGQSVESPVSVQRHLTTAARKIPRASTSGSSSTASSINTHEGKGVKQQQSAPVNIPDWSKVYGKKTKKSSSKNASSWLDLEDDVDDDDDDDRNSDDDDDDDDEDDGEYSCKVPPHEFLTRRLARSQISSFSVFEGVGRTLKGRDLSKVRNAILTKTGFLE